MSETMLTIEASREVGVGGWMYIYMHVLRALLHVLSGINPTFWWVFVSAPVFLFPAQ